MNFINDNNPPGPEVTVTEANICHRPKAILDSEPYTELVHLSCGHRVYNTYGDKSQRKNIGDKMRCLLCNLEGSKA